MRTGIILLAALLAIETVQVALAEDIEALKAGVVKIRSQAEGNPRRTGTGFIVSITPDAVVILTASHVIEGDAAPEVEFFTNRGTRIEAEVSNSEPGDPRGLAILRIARKKLPEGIVVLPLAAARVADGTVLKVIGFPRGGADWSVVSATVSGRLGRDMTLDGTIKEGNSGGPVFKGNEVVAVVTEMTEFARATPAATVTELLANWGVVNKASPSGAGPSTSAPAGACVQGYVWRDAFAGDRVCVLPSVRAVAAYDNSQAEARKQPGGGPYGPDTCRQGYVWREASPSDLVCVKPETRDQTRKDNQLAPTRVAR